MTEKVEESGSIDSDPSRDSGLEQSVELASPLVAELDSLLESAVLRRCKFLHLRSSDKAIISSFGRFFAKLWAICCATRLAFIVAISLLY